MTEILNNLVEKYLKYEKLFMYISDQLNDIINELQKNFNFFRKFSIINYKFL